MIFELLYIYPRCGEDIDINKYILSLYSLRCTNADRIITPPNECPMKDNRPRDFP